MLALVAALPRDAATTRALHGPSVAWGDSEHLLALIVDLLAGANWQRSGGKSPKPKPIPRPGRALLDEEVTRLGSGSWSIDEMRQKLDRVRGRA